MVFRTLREVLDCVRQSHHNMSLFYSNNREAVNDVRLKFLLDYLSRHEKEFEENMRRFESKTAPKLMDTWFKHLPDSRALQGCEDIRITRDMGIDDVLKQALGFDQCLMDFYTRMSEICVIPEIREIFTNLAEMERIDEHKLVQQTMELKEL